MAPRSDLRGPGEGPQDPLDLPELDLQAESAQEESDRHLRELVLEAARAPKPAPTERDHLLAAAGEGDGPAAERLVKAGLEMVIRQAASRAGRGLPIDEMVQEGSLGLVSAVRNFSASGRPDYEAYAEEKVGAAIEAALAEEEEAQKESLRLVTDAEAFERAELLVAADLRRRPTDEEVGQRLEWTPERAKVMGDIVREARLKHDQELLSYIDPDQLDLDSLVDPDEIDPEDGLERT